MRSSPDWLYRLKHSGSPLTYCLMAFLVIVFLIVFLGSGSHITFEALENLVFRAENIASKPWTLFTYWWFSGASPFSLFFLLIVLYFFGTSLERGWRTKRYGLFLFSQSLLTPVAFWIGDVILGRSPVLFSFGILSGTIVVAFCALNPNAIIRFMFVVEVLAKWLMILPFAFVALSYGWGNPVFAIFAVVPLVVSIFHVRGGIALPSIGSKSKREPTYRYREGDYAGIDWEKKRQAEEERRKLKELFERSWDESEENDKNT
jgi:uncharacterized membrane protein